METAIIAYCKPLEQLPNLRGPHIWARVTHFGSSILLNLCRQEDSECGWRKSSCTSQLTMLFLNDQSTRWTSNNMSVVIGPSRHLHSYDRKSVELTSPWEETDSASWWPAGDVYGRFGDETVYRRSLHKVRQLLESTWEHKPVDRMVQSCKTGSWMDNCL